MVLAAKPPPPAPLLTGKGKVSESWSLPMAHGDVEPYRKLVAAYPPEVHGPMFAKPVDGFSWMVMVMFSLNTNQSEVLDFMLENGQADHTNTSSVGLSPLI